MESERIVVEDLKSPQCFQIRNVTSKIAMENCAIFNCVPPDYRKKKTWEESTVQLLNYWLFKARDVWFFPMVKNQGLLFFRDHEQRIVNARIMLVELKLAANESFLNQKKENMFIKVLKGQWLELHDLSIDYSQFLTSPGPSKPIMLREEKLFGDVVVVPEVYSIPGKWPLKIKPRSEKTRPLSPTNKEDEGPNIKKCRFSSTVQAPVEDMPSVVEDGNPNEALDAMLKFQQLIDESMRPVRAPTTGEAAAVATTANCYKFYWGAEPIFNYGKDHPVPYTTLKDVPFDDKMKSQIPSQNLTFQLHVWSRCLTGGSVIAIEPTGEKKFVFEATIFDYVMKKILSNHVGTGPLAVIISDTRSEALNLINYFKILNGNYTQQVQIKTLLDGYYHSPDDVCKFLKCNILITTPGMMVYLLRERADGYNLDSVQWLVIQNIDKMKHQQQAEDLREALIYFAPLHKKQVIVTSTIWLGRFKKLFNDMMQPLICFASPLAVALKEKSDMHLKICQGDEEQLENLLGILRPLAGTSSRIAVVTSTAQKLDVIKETLQRLAIPFYALGDAPNTANILLMTDNLIQTMNVDTVDVLVNYSIPKMPVFAKRFVLFEKHLIDQTPTKTHILLNINEHADFLKQMEYLLKNDVLSGQTQIAEICYALKARQENLPENLHRQFCEQMAVNGRCRNPFSCPERHSLNDTDIPDYRLPLGKGEIEMKIQSVVAPNHFLVEIVPPKKFADEIEMNRQIVKFDVDPYFWDVANRIPKTTFTVGDLCIFHEGMYRRARITDVTIRRGHRQTIRVKVQCMETGNPFLLDSEIDRVYEMPEEFRHIPAQAIDVYLLGFVPMEPESGWCKDSLNYLNAHIENRSGRRFRVFGKVALTTNHRIYLKTLEIKEVLESSLTLIPSLNVKEQLIGDRLAKADDASLEMLTKMADAFDLKSKVKLEPLELPTTGVNVKVKVIDVDSDVVVAEDLKVQEICPKMENEDVEMIEMTPEVDFELKTEELSESDNQDSPRMMEEVDNPEEGDYPEIYPDDGVEDLRMTEEQWEDNNHESFEYTPQELAEFDDNFDDEDIMQLCEILKINEMFGPTAAKTSRAILPAPTTEPPAETIQAATTLLTEHSQPKPFLTSNVKYPEMCWSQSDEEIKLRISATDVLNYAFDPMESNMMFCLEFAGGEMKGGVINFFGLVDEEDYSVELRGLTIFVTLKKILPGKKFNWPRLLKTKQAMRWLKFYQKFDNFDNETLDDEWLSKYAGLYVADEEYSAAPQIPDKVDELY